MKKILLLLAISLAFLRCESESSQNVTQQQPIAQRGDDNYTIDIDFVQLVKDYPDTDIDHVLGVINEIESDFIAQESDPNATTAHSPIKHCKNGITHTYIYDLGLSWCLGVKRSEWPAENIGGNWTIPINSPNTYFVSTSCGC